MQSILRPHSLWRAQPLTTCLRVRVQVLRGPSTRFMSNSYQDNDEISLHDRGGLSGRVHILGIGNVGSFIAHSLATRRSPPPITLCMHNDYVRSDFAKKRGSISVSTHGLDDVRSGFDVETIDEFGTWSQQPRKDYRPSPFITDGPDILVDDSPIDCLIVCTKAHRTELAIRDIKHRLTKDSTICFVHNGMGVVDIINQKIFPNPDERPRYINSVFSHGLTRKDNFKFAHMGVGSFILSPVPTGLTSEANEDLWTPSTKYLMRLLTLTPALVAMAETPAGLDQYQLEKLAVNCVINPLTTLSDCTNGELLYSFSFTRVMRLLLFEISAVICALPELQGVPGIEERFSPERLRRLVVNLARMTADNSSSMRQDLMNKRRTEIEFTNGYIVRRGEELGITCPLNYMIKHMVTAKVSLDQDRERGYVPFDLEDDIDISSYEPSV